MEYTTLGETGVEVSRICLGYMGFGGSGGRMFD
jgi:aryl-alcohol dehydrogenase-like predicted oxidoreductase